MARRLKKNVSHYKNALVPSQRRWSRPIFPEKRYEVAGSILRITTYVPRPVAQRVRREIYPYPYPNQKQKRGRAIRLALAPTRGPYVKATVRIRMPRRLPIVRGSYVSVTPKLVTIHSRNQVERLENAQERNRRRYTERKGFHRKGRYGQLDSPGSRRLGIVAKVAQRGGSVDQIADAALAARAMSLKGRRR